MFYKMKIIVWELVFENFKAYNFFHSGVELFHYIAHIVLLKAKQKEWKMVPLFQTLQQVIVKLSAFGLWKGFFYGNRRIY